MLLIKTLALLQVLPASLDLEGNESRDVIPKCEAAICDQINRKISAEESASILYRYADNNAPAKLIQKVLHAIDHHKPVIGLSDKNKGSHHCMMWRQEEDILLLAAIHKYGLGDWKSIAYFVGGGRSRSQCSQRWGRAMDPKIAKAPWTEQEDKILLDMVNEYGEHSWANISRKMGNRSDVQCRYRFFLLTKRGKSGKPAKRASPNSPIYQKFDENQSDSKTEPKSKDKLVIQEQENSFVKYNVLPISVLLPMKSISECSVDELFPPLIMKSQAHSEPTSPIYSNQF